MTSYIDASLEHLPPSKELVQHFRDKLLEYENDNNLILNKIDEFSNLCDRQYRLETDIQERNEDIQTLQKALSELQHCLLQEREHVLRLYSENDRLKIQEVEDKRKIQQLLVLTGNDPHRHFLLDLPECPIADTQSKGSRTKARDPPPDDRTNRIELEVLALKAQLTEQAEVAKNEIKVLQAERSVSLKESEVQHSRDSAKIKFLVNKMHQTEDSLKHCIGDCLEKRKQIRRLESQLAIERATSNQLRTAIPTEPCMNLSHEPQAYVPGDSLQRQPCHLTRGLSKPPSKSALKTNTDHVNVSQQTSATANLLGIKNKITQVCAPGPKHTTAFTQTSVNYKAQIQRLKEELNQAKKLSNLYQQQCVGLESLICQLREENACTLQTYKCKMDKMKQELQTVKCRQKNTDVRNRFQAEGFRTDIKNLRSEIQCLEKQLLKAINHLKRGSEDLDMLAAVEATTCKAQEICNQLVATKAKIYQLEQELRNL